MAKKRKRITEEDIAKALDKFKSFKQSKQVLETRIQSNERWFRLRQWDDVGKVKGKEDLPEPASAWMFNSIINKHADAMDNFPAPIFLPREKSDEEEAERLQKIIPIILDANNYEQVYSDTWYYKLKMGTAINGVFWDNEKENGLGDVVVKKVDLLNCFWQPGVLSLQESTDFFTIGLEYKDKLEEQYPELKDQLVGGVNGDVVKYTSYENNNNFDHEKMVVVYDWYYKKANSSGVSVLHYCKFVEGHILYASENEEEYAESGYYEHGMYPFVSDTLFPTEDSFIGFGYIDIMKSPQIYTDKLDQIMLTNAAIAGKPRFFKSSSTNVNMQQFKDWNSTDIVTVDGPIDETRLRQMQVANLPAYISNHMQYKVEELKETSGNRDFSQGSTQSGVTAASAIAALQEAGSKLSRDMIKSSYRAHKKIIELVLGTMKQFYTEDRYFRIEGPNGVEYIKYNNSGIANVTTTDATGQPITRTPVFDIKIQAQKQSPFSREAQNERAKELFGLGVFNPNMAQQALAMLEMMEFEGIEKVREAVKRNDAVMQASQMLIQLAMQMAQQIDVQSTQLGMPSMMSQQVAQLASQITGQAMEFQQADVKVMDEDGKKGSAGMPGTENTIATKARNRVASASTPKV